MTTYAKSRPSLKIGTAQLDQQMLIVSASMLYFYVLVQRSLRTVRSVAVINCAEIMPRYFLSRPPLPLFSIRAILVHRLTAIQNPFTLRLKTLFFSQLLYLQFDRSDLNGMKGTACSFCKSYR